LIRLGEPVLLTPLTILGEDLATIADATTRNPLLVNDS